MSDDPTSRVLAAIRTLGSELSAETSVLGTALRSEITGLRGDVTVVRSEITGLRGDITVVHGEIAELRGEITVARGEITTLRSEITTMRSEITTLRVDVMERIDRRQDRVTSLHDDVGVNFARTDRVDERSNGIEREVRAMGVEMSAMQRQIQRLQTDMRHLKGET
jgi:chromosome segregation ATPase